ncbi:MAG TPA: VWA domain-containing protein [Gaiellaceae bacterium]|nr:VWA domain-containing protein [Gaiellaceae bacterium]
MRRLLAPLAAVVLAAGLAASARADSSAGFTHLTPIGRVRAPERGFLLDLPPATQISRGQVTVSENGRPVRPFSLTPIQAVEGRFGIVLVLDASDSMRGPAAQAALNAARAFVRQAGSSERIGVVAFNSRATVLAAPKDGAEALAGALAEPPKLAYGTRIYDALGTALQQFEGSDVSSGTVVLLSDGADTGSRVSEQQLVRQARSRHIRIFTVGLRSPSFKPDALRRIANSTGGTYFEAASIADLASIYGTLGRRLSTEYVLTYRSQSAPGTHVSVLVRIAGVGDVSATYVTPRPAPITPFHRSVFERFWSSPASLGLVALLAAGLAALGAVLLVRVPKGTLLKRIGEFVSVAPPEEEAQRKALTTKVFAGAEESLAKTRWWAQFNEELEIARIPVPAVHILVATAVVTLLVAVIALLISPLFVVVALAVPFIAHSLVRRKLKRVRDDFAEQLPDNLQVLASALRAGHSFVGALAVVAADAPEPAQREFRRVVADDQLGVSIDDSLRDVARRMDSSELEQVGLLAELQRESGGNMAEVLDTVVETIRERFDLRRLIQTLTAQGRMARWILTLLPIFLAAIIALLNPAYMQPLFGTTAGRVLVLLAVVMVVSGSLVIKRIVNIKV